MKNFKQKIGITGGIGSGKTYVSKIIESFNYPVFYSDIIAKEIVNSNQMIQSKIKNIFGSKAFINNEYNKKYIASIIFENKNKLNELNQIIHPAVQKRFEQWMINQKSKIVFYESALIFENNRASFFDYVILVISNMETRIKRIIERDKSSKTKILHIINNQLSDEKKIKKSNFIIENNDNSNLNSQILNLLDHICFPEKKY